MGAERRRPSVRPPARTDGRTAAIYVPSAHNTIRSHAWVRRSNGLLLHEPWEVQVDMQGQWAGHFGTLMPYYR